MNVQTDIVINSSYHLTGLTYRDYMKKNLLYKDYNITF